MKKIAIIFCLLSACSQSEDRAPEQDIATSTTPSAPAARFDQALIESAESALRKEPKVVDLLHENSALGVDWTVGVKDDGSNRRGYAAYLCLVLSDHKVVDKYTDVRIVDVQKYLATGDARSSSLGHVQCYDGADLGV